MLVSLLYNVGSKRDSAYDFVGMDDTAYTVMLEEAQKVCTKPKRLAISKRFDFGPKYYIFLWPSHMLIYLILKAFSWPLFCTLYTLNTLIYEQSEVVSTPTAACT